MRTWRGIGITSTMRSTRLWDCRWGVGWSRVRVSGSSNSASREWGCAGVRLDLTICYISDSLGSTARLRRCFRYSSNHPPTRNYAPCSDLSLDIGTRFEAYIAFVFIHVPLWCLHPFGG